MLLFLFACIEPAGTVVGNPGSLRDPNTHMARVTVAESDGFTYTQATLRMDRIEYMTTEGLTETIDVSTSLDLLSENNTFDLQAGTYRKVTMYFSEITPFSLSFQHTDAEAGSLSIPLASLVFQQESLEIDSDVVLEIGGPNWLTLPSLNNVDLLGTKISYQSEIYDDENSNGVVEEEEREEPITEPAAATAESYRLTGRWTASTFTFGDSVFEDATLDLDDSGYFFSSDQQSSLSGDVESNRVRTCGSMMTIPTEKSGQFTSQTFHNNDVIHSTGYTFLDHNTLILYHDSNMDGVVDSENILVRDSTVTDLNFDFSVPLPLPANIIGHLNFSNISVGSEASPVHSSDSENLSVFACEPERIHTEPMVTIAPSEGLLITSATGEHEKDVWVHIPISMVSYIHFDGEFHLHDSHNWHNLWLTNGGAQSASFSGNPTQLHIQTLSSGSVLLSGTTTWLDIQVGESADAESMIRGYEMPAEEVTVNMSGAGQAEIQPLQYVQGTMVGSGSLYSAGTEQVVYEVAQQGSGELICVCDEESPPSVCE